MEKGESSLLKGKVDVYKVRPIGVSPVLPVLEFHRREEKDGTFLAVRAESGWLEVPTEGRLLQILAGAWYLN